MNKPASLRAAIEAALPDLKKNPDRLLVFIDQGSVQATAARGLSFEYAYTLQVVVTDYAAHADTLLVPVLVWVAQHQNELLANPERREGGITFEADLLNHNSMDLALSLQLTERVIVRPVEGGGYTSNHPSEPPLDPYDGIDWSLMPQLPDEG